MIVRNEAPPAFVEWAERYAIVSVVGHTWTLEECGDRDASGVRVLNAAR